MGKATGFLDYTRQGNRRISEELRIKNFDEFYNRLDKDERRLQGGRCMDCGVPFCTSAIELRGMVTGCPLHNLIPEWNDEIYNENYALGLERLLKTSAFPEFTGRVCPALCEKACICGLHGDAVTVRDNELFLIEEGFKNGLMAPKPPKVRSGKKVAVIGSGPSGLATAERLNKRGHLVTVFERDDRIGGLLMYGIPNMKLDKNVIFRRMELMQAEGVTFVTNADFGKNLDENTLLQEFDAVVLCCGAKNARDLTLENRNSDGVYFAVDFLSSTTKSIIEKHENYISAKDKNVIVLGGGDTGNDCVGTSIRHGAKSVVQIEMMKKPPEERLASNPWPEWPKVLNTDYGQEEAIYVYGSDPRVFETTIKEIITTDGKLSSVVTVSVAFENGKLIEIEGTEKTLDADLLLISAGFLGTETYMLEKSGINLPTKADVSYKTNVDKIFACGDMKRGQSLVVWAVADGTKCAREVDEFLAKY